MKRSSAAIWLAWTTSVLAAQPPPGKGTTDLVTLRDGTMLRGEVRESAPRSGSYSVIVRREWARKHAPELLKKWEAAEAGQARQAITQRRARLEAWKRERGDGQADDRINAWISQELDRLGKDNGSKSPLVVAKLSRGEVKSVEKADPGNASLLRLAWVSGLHEPENLKIDDLKDALESRGFGASPTGNVSIDALLPPAPETDRVWLIRRAATEISFDPDLRYVRHGPIVFPESAGAQGLNLNTGVMAASLLKDLLGENAEDPWQARLKTLAASRKAGAMLTALEVSPDLTDVNVTITMWVRPNGEQWVPAGSRTARVKPGEIAADAGDELAADPQVATVFKAVEALGFGGIDPEIKRKSLGIGAATKKAIGIARSAAEADLSALALPILDRRKDEPAPVNPVRK